MARSPAGAMLIEMTDQAALVQLTRSDCLELLAATEVGRIVLTMDDIETPLIRPVNYRFHAPSQSIVFRTGAGTKFDELVRCARALFEIDSLDPDTRTGWSVILSGVTEYVTEADEIRRLDQLGLDTWALGGRPHWIRIRTQTISGRRIVRCPGIDSHAE
jgi:uncharacterized protein